MLSRWQSTIVDAKGNVQPLANLTVRLESDQSLAKIWASPSTSQPLPDGMLQADGNGYAYFYAEGGLYRITSATLGIDWRHVPLGTAAASDVTQTVGQSTTAVMSQKAVTNELGEVTEALGQVQVQGAASWSPDGTPYPIRAQVYHNSKQWLALRANSVEPVEGDDWTELVGKQYVDANTPDFTGYLQPSMTGSATLNGTTDNTVQLTNIVTTLGLEVGDVIRIQYSGYNKLHSVESITNNDLIVVNYEHAGNRANGSLKLADQATTVTITRIAKWYNAPLGLGQAWVNVKASRLANTDYTNSTGRTISVFASLGFAPVQVTQIVANGVVVGIWGLAANSASQGASAVVQRGAVYRVENSQGSANVQRWAELR